MPFSYQQALAYIHSFDDPYLAALRDHGKQTWGLDGIRELLAKWGNPHLACPTIHVAGTKGKGSTSAFIAQGLIESGLKTGLYTSPHLEDWRERIQINRELIGEEALARLVEDAKPYLDEKPLSAFEVTTALAFWHFAREGCDVAVIEVGLGGRLDATSVVEPVVAVLTSISLDHMQLLGDTVAQIAAEKAAIIKPGVPVVSAPQMPEAQAVIEQRVEQTSSALTLVGRDWLVQPLSQSWEGSKARIGNSTHTATYTIGLPGLFQIENAAVALAALTQAAQAGLPITAQGMAAGLERARWPGRLEAISRRPLIVLDGAHNPYSIHRLVESLAILSPGQRMTFVFGCMADKDSAGMLAELWPVARRVILTRADHPRAAATEMLLAQADRIVSQARASDTGQPDAVVVSVAASTAEAVQQALAELQPGDALCITGSLSIVGEARALLRNRIGIVSTVESRDPPG